MAWREDRETGVWRNEGGNGTAAHVVRVGTRYAWNVQHRDSLLAGGWSNTLEGAKDTAEDRPIVAERAHTDEDDPHRARADRHRVRGFERDVDGTRERVRPHMARNPRRGR